MTLPLAPTSEMWEDWLFSRERAESVVWHQKVARHACVQRELHDPSWPSTGIRIVGEIGADLAKFPSLLAVLLRDEDARTFRRARGFPGLVTVMQHVGGQGFKLFFRYRRSSADEILHLVRAATIVTAPLSFVYYHDPLLLGPLPHYVLGFPILLPAPLSHPIFAPLEKVDW